VANPADWAWGDEPLAAGCAAEYGEDGWDVACAGAPGCGSGLARAELAGSMETSAGIEVGAGKRSVSGEP
jgi:hypothetical protein